MSGNELFIGGVLATSLVLIAFRVKSPVDYFRSRDGQGVAKGIVLAIGVSLAFLFVPRCAAGEWLTDVDLYFGLDHTNKPSPQCEDRGPDNRLTSNLGLRGTLYRVSDRTAWVGLQYTHHSCALSPDRESYDAIGITYTKRLFSR